MILCCTVDHEVNINVVITLSHALSFFFGKDVRFKLFSNGTLRINNVEVYDGHLYSCESKTEAGKLSAQARVYVLGEEHLLCCFISKFDCCFEVGFSMAEAIVWMSRWLI